MAMTVTRELFELLAPVLNLPKDTRRLELTLDIEDVPNVVVYRRVTEIGEKGEA
jgi:hypothetical protein